MSLPVAGGKRKRFSFAEKYEILQELDKGAKRTFVQEKYGVAHGTLAGFIKKREEIEASVKKPTSLAAKNTRQSSFPELDTALLEWFRQIRSDSSDVSISGADLLLKAEEIVTKLKERDVDGYDLAVVDKNWIDRWKKRHGVAKKLIVGESASADEPAAKTWLDMQVKLIRDEFADADIFNADETGLFWRMTPDKTLAFKGEVCKGGKHSKERVTALVAASAAGEKLPMFVIGKSKRPHCFRGVINLPVTYEANKNAWMTSTLFEQWCTRLNNRMRGQGRKIALILDNFSGHPHLELSHIKMFFLPPNTTSLTQPMDAGIIKNLKHHYRRFLVKKRLACLDAHVEFKVNLLDAVQWLKHAWNLVTAQTIVNCYRHVGFQAPATDDETGAQCSDDSSDEDEAGAAWQAAQESGLADDNLSFAEFVNIDEAVFTGASSVETDTILDSVLPVPPVDSEDSEDEEELLEVVPTFREAMEGFDRTLAYLRTVDSTGNHAVAVQRAQEYCMDSYRRRMQQGKITSFFTKP